MVKETGGITVVLVITAVSPSVLVLRCILVKLSTCLYFPGHYSKDHTAHYSLIPHNENGERRGFHSSTAALTCLTLSWTGIFVL